MASRTLKEPVYCRFSSFNSKSQFALSPKRGEYSSGV